MAIHSNPCPPDLDPSTLILPTAYVETWDGERYKIMDDHGKHYTYERENGKRVQGD